MNKSSLPSLSKIRKALKSQAISPLERNIKNPLYYDFLENCKKQNLSDKPDDDYEWKCYLCKKYFRDNLVNHLLIILLGIIISVFSIYLINTGKLRVSGMLISVVWLFSFCYCIGFGFLASIFYFKMYRHYKDYVWNEEGTLSKKIIRFYS